MADYVLELHGLVSSDEEGVGRVACRTQTVSNGEVVAIWR